MCFSLDVNVNNAFEEERPTRPNNEREIQKFCQAKEFCQNERLNQSYQIMNQ